MATVTGRAIANWTIGIINCEKLFQNCIADTSFELVSKFKVKLNALLQEDLSKLELW